MVRDIGGSSSRAVEVLWQEMRVFDGKRASKRGGNGSEGGIFLLTRAVSLGGGRRGRRCEKRSIFGEKGKMARTLQQKCLSA